MDQQIDGEMKFISFLASRLETVYGNGFACLEHFTNTPETGILSQTNARTGVASQQPLLVSGSGSAPERSNIYMSIVYRTLF